MKYPVTSVFLALSSSTLVSAFGVPRNEVGFPKVTSLRATDNDSSGITRIGVENPNMSQAVIHGGIVYISGQVDDTGSDAKSQTSNILDKVDSLLEQAGTDKSKLLTASIWLKDIGQDFQEVNRVWNTWLDSDNKPVRAAGKIIISLSIIKIVII